MKKLFTPITFLLFALTAFAQPQRVAHLTIFSEDGDKFFLILNGERQNDVAQTNLRVEDLTQDYYNAKIIFEDKSLAEISKNNLMLTDADGTKQDVTYKIRRDKNVAGKMKFNFFSMTPVVQGYVAPRNVAVVHYGVPVAQPTAVIATPSGTVTQTTTTTTRTNGTGAGINMNVDGIGINVQINDPLLDTRVTQTTTTTTRTNETVVVAPPPVQQVGCVNAIPMGGGDFSSALGTIRGQSFEETKLKTAKQIAGSNCLSTAQITQICQLFSFEGSKLDFAKFAYNFCTDPRSYFKVNNVFSFSSSSDELNEYLQGR